MVTNAMPGETCIGPQPDGTCLEVYIPDCVDRTIYCNPLPSFENATVELLNEPEVGSPNLLDTSYNLTCQEKNNYFDYSVPANLVSFYYSTNINEMTLTCLKEG